MTRYCVQASWEDVPHLTTQQRSEMLSALQPYERDARSRGIPMLGAGRIYPVPEEVILVEPFEIPSYWPRAYGLDVGWNRTACVWGAWDRQSDTVYLYSEHYMGEAPPVVHAQAIKDRGEWIPGAIDPASAGAGQLDGRRLSDEYQELGLDLVYAENVVEAGIRSVYSRLAAGRLKVFRTLPNWLTEYRIYRRDEKGKVVKERDHLMDATRYLIMTGMRVARTEPLEGGERDGLPRGRHGVTGY